MSRSLKELGGMHLNTGQVNLQKGNTLPTVLHLELIYLPAMEKAKPCDLHCLELR